MLTKHLLVVGTSLTDDNFLRLAYEVTNYLRSTPEGKAIQNEPLGTVLALGPNPTRQETLGGNIPRHWSIRDTGREHNRYG